MIFDPKIDPKTTQDGLKTGPRGFQRRSFFMLIFAFDFGPFWDSFWSHFGSLLDPKIGPKSNQKSSKKLAAATYPHKTTLRRPKNAPRGPKTPPRGLKIPPRSPQDPPKRLPRGSKRDPRPPETPPNDLRNTPRWSQYEKILSERIRLILQLHSMTVLLASTMHF